MPLQSATPCPNLQYSHPFHQSTLDSSTVTRLLGSDCRQPGCKRTVVPPRISDRSVPGCAVRATDTDRSTGLAYSRLDCQSVKCFRRDGGQSSWKTAVDRMNCGDGADGQCPDSIRLDSTFESNLSSTGGGGDDGDSLMTISPFRAQTPATWPTPWRIRGNRE
ncbi:unnamed protein product [Calypogeia fissa]